jgi:sugar lactone lactonase YvrE
MNMLATLTLTAGVAGTAVAGGAILLSSGPLADTKQSARADESWFVTTIAGSGAADYQSGYRDAAAGSAEFSGLSALAIAPDGTVYLSDSGNRRIRSLSADRTAVSTFAGSGDEGVADGAAASASFVLPGGLLVGPNAELYISDSGGHRIRIAFPSGDVITLAGGGDTGLAGGGFQDGATDTARFDLPAGLAFDRDGKLLVADKNNHAIRVVTPDGQVTTLAGGPTLHGHVDGPLAQARFSAPVAVAVSSDGSIYVLEHGNNALRVIRPDLSVHTLLGGGPPCGAPADCANSARTLNYASGMAIGPDGAIYIADRTRILRVLDSGADVTVVAGTSESEFRDGSPGGFLDAVDIVVTDDGSLIVVDAGASRVRLLMKEG